MRCTTPACDACHTVFCGAAAGRSSPAWPPAASGGCALGCHLLQSGCSRHGSCMGGHDTHRFKHHSYMTARDACHVTRSFRKRSGACSCIADTQANVQTDAGLLCSPVFAMLLGGPAGQSVLNVCSLSSHRSANLLQCSAVQRRGKAGQCEHKLSQAVKNVTQQTQQILGIQTTAHHANPSARRLCEATHDTEVCAGLLCRLKAL